MNININVNTGNAELFSVIFDGGCALVMNIEYQQYEKIFPFYNKH